MGSWGWGLGEWAGLWKLFCLSPHQVTQRLLEVWEPPLWGGVDPPWQQITPGEGAGDSLSEDRLERHRRDYPLALKRSFGDPGVKYLEGTPFSSYT